MPTNCCACAPAPEEILLASNYEEAERLALRYRDCLLGVVSDVEFPRRGELSVDAGFDLAPDPEAGPGCTYRAAIQPNPVRERAFAQGLSFLRKRSPTLLADLRRVVDRTVRVR